MPKRNGKGSTKRPTHISREEEAKRWLISMAGTKLKPSCDYCSIKSLKALCGLCYAYDKFSPPTEISHQGIYGFGDEDV